MRILHVINRYWPATGGAERHLQEYAERQAADGHQVTVFTTDAVDLEYFWDTRKRSVERHRDTHNGVRIERFPIAHLPPNELGFRAARRLLGEVNRLPGTTALLRRLSAFAPRVPGLHLALRETAGGWDAVHGMNVAFEALLYPALAHARVAKVPFLLSPLTHLGESERSLVRRYYTMKHQIDLMRNADVLFTQTPTEQAYLESRGVRRERMVGAGPGVDPGAVTGGDGARFRERYGITGPIVFSVGAMARDKGTFHVVAAMQRLWAKGVDAELVLAGTPYEEMRRFMALLPPETRDRVRMLGLISDQDKLDLMAAGDVFALPSRTDSFGIVYLEAWLNGSPVIAADAGGVPDVVEHERGGLIVPFGDVQALCGAIRRLLADRELSRSMAEHGARVTRERYTWDRIYERVSAAFEKVVR